MIKISCHIRCAILAIVLAMVIVSGLSGSAWTPAVDAESSEAMRVTETDADGASNMVTVPVVMSNYVPPVSHPFGVQMYGSLADENVSHDLLRSSGTRWVRWELSWSAIEPVEATPAEYNWYCDGALLTAYQQGIELIVTINGNPRWAAVETPDGYYANGPIKPEKLDRFAQFVRATVERYDGDGTDDAPGSPVVRYFEFYNEPDNGSEPGGLQGGPYWGPFGQEYAEMLCTVYPVAKAASPHAMIVFGGIAYDRFWEQEPIFVESFASDVFADGGSACFDIMNFHFYFFANRPWKDYGPDLMGKANAVRALLQDAGIGDKPLMCTEAGAPSAVSYTPGDPKATPAVQARRAAIVAIESVAADLESVIWWMWKDRGIDPLPYYGLVTTTLRPKPSLDAYQVAVEEVGDAILEEILYLDTKVEAYRFRTPQGTRLYTLWVIDDPVQEPPPEIEDRYRNVTIPLTSATITDLYGNSYVRTDGDDGYIDSCISLTIGLDPIYVEELP